MLPFVIYLVTFSHISSSTSGISISSSTSSISSSSTILLVVVVLVVVVLIVVVRWSVWLFPCRELVFLCEKHPFSQIGAFLSVLSWFF